MKVVLAGYGKMGRLLETRLLEKGHQVLAAVDPYYKGPFYKGDSYPGATKPGADKPGSSSSAPQEMIVYASLEDALKGAPGKSLKDADVVFEFTQPDQAVKNLLFLAKEKIPTVTGTTGWYGKLDEVSQAVNAEGSSLVWSSNYSLGVNIFYRIAANAAKLMDPFAEYDVAGCETHHNKKADSPSGTAKTLVERVLAQMTRKKKAVYEMLDRPPAADELHYASVRVGTVPGIHSLLFDSAAETIEITHTARNRGGFAAGAVLAAEWLTAKKRIGVFTVDDAFADILPQ